MTNHLVGKRNAEVMSNTTNTIFIIHAAHGRADGHTGISQVMIMISKRQET